MSKEIKRTLKQLNAFNEEGEDDFRVDKLLDGVYHGTIDYTNYLKSAKKVIQDQNAIAIPVQLVQNQKDIWRYSLDIDNMEEKKSSKVKKHLFTDEQKTIYSRKPTGNHKSDKINEIDISDRNEEELYLDFNQDPDIDKTIYLKANDYQIRMQEKAISTLKNYPESHHTALLRLFDLPYKSKSYFEDIYNDLDIDFKILNDLNINGVIEQQEFVKKALASKDFALLEGPPGSGKTTAIIELIIQCISQGQRVLIVSSTHVAVDNVIDSIVGKYKKHTEGLISPMRIASNIEVIRKESVKDFHLEKIIKHTKKEMLKNLNTKKDSEGVRALKKSINSNKPNSNFDKIILDSANLVGGTAIGILQHPEIKSGTGKPFDVMIVDEASKVTFLDFLVPALHAKKWVLVGDVNQLSPYTEGDIITEHLNKLLEKESQELITETFDLHKDIKFRNDKKIIHVLFTDKDTLHFTNLKDSNLEIVHLNAENSSSNTIGLLLNSVDVIIAKPTEANETLLAKHLKFKAKFYSKPPKNASLLHHQNHYHKGENRKKTWINDYTFKLDTDQNWGELVGNNLEQMYQYRFEPDLEKNKKEEFDILVPASIEKGVEGLRRVALPSILELLQIGIGEKEYTKKDGTVQNVEKILYSGFNKMPRVKERKFQSLRYQHRMQDEIALYAREHFYENNENLNTANTVGKRDNLLEDYKRDEDAIIWMSNNYNSFKNRKTKKQRIINLDEVSHIENELRSFQEFSKPKLEQEYEVAVLTFYRDQEIELKTMLRELTGQSRKNNFFTLQNIKITLCTVDKFQGDEADMVLLSFAKTSRGAFYNSPNRVNVAITRARYKLVLFGNPEKLKKKAGLPALREMAKDIKVRLSSNKTRN